MDETLAWRGPHNKTALVVEGLALDQLLQKRFTLTDRNDRSFGQGTTQLFVKDTDGATAQDDPGVRVVATGAIPTLTDQLLIAMQLAVMAGHQPKTAQCPMNPLQRVSGIKHLK